MSKKQDLTYTYPNSKLFDAMRICYIYNVVRPDEVPQKIEDINDLTNEQRRKRFSKLKYEEQVEFFELEELMRESGYNAKHDIINGERGLLCKDYIMKEFIKGSKKLNKGKQNDK